MPATHTQLRSAACASLLLGALFHPLAAEQLPADSPPVKEDNKVVEAGEKTRLAELDAYWKEVSRAVREGDFDAYVATCHPEGVLVSGSKRLSQPLATALARWKQDFINTREGKVRGNVEFRFSNRIGDASTAHETGIFHYISLVPGENPKHEWFHLEALLVKRGDSWKILMENQIGPATQAEWDALK